MPQTTLEEKSINALRLLSADMVQQAGSGHPGLPMGAAALVFTIWTRHLRHNPAHPDWPGRDRFILSGGHGSALLYSVLHLTGYDLPLAELQRFRQWGSRTPGHPEAGLTPGVETTTGPLGQGFANGVGMAIAESHLAAEFNRPGFELVDHYTYGLVTDGDLMEGIASEAASLAGHLQLGKLIYLYDDNHISIDGSTDLAFTERRLDRFAAYGWHVQQVADGNDVEAVDTAIRAAKADPRPSLVACRTVIGFGAPTRQGTSAAHGEPLGEAELAAAKQVLGWPQEPKFHIPPDVQEFFHASLETGEQAEAGWQERFERYRRAHPGLADEFERRVAGRLPEDWAAALPAFPPDARGLASRAASGRALNALAAALPELVGGSADLAPSNKSWLDGFPAFQREQRAGRNFHFGVREHAMGAILNGMALHGGLIPYGATFLVFSDYMRGAIRLAALSHIPVIYIFTHDSIGVGEDGPTHQPVEHLAALRAIPGLTVIRPGDASETAEAWKCAIANRRGPTTLILSRQNLPTLDRSAYAGAAGLQRGAYVLADPASGDPQLILMATGSEVGLIVAAGSCLAAEGLRVRLVSFPSWELFEQQPDTYRQAVLPPGITARLAVEAGVRQGWERWTGGQGRVISLEHFGASAPAPELFEAYGFTVGNVVETAHRLLEGSA
ncbi:MAG: transketolase [Chloroflexi bacterium]|nr:transketolase [Chloroflexota bacterium]